MVKREERDLHEREGIEVRGGEKEEQSTAFLSFSFSY